MIKKWQPIYPSSRVSSEVIEAYGWMFVEELPARGHPNSGSLVPIPEASEYLRDLRRKIDGVDTITLATSEGDLVIEDFAVANVSNDSQKKLGFFALVHKE